MPPTKRGASAEHLPGAKRVRVSIAASRVGRVVVEQVSATIAQLGDAEACNDEFLGGCTHLVVPEDAAVAATAAAADSEAALAPRMAQKVLAALALTGGRVRIVTPRWLRACAAGGRWVDADSALHAPQFVRDREKRSAAGLFCGKRVAVSPPPASDSKEGAARAASRAAFYALLRKVVEAEGGVWAGGDDCSEGLLRLSGEEVVAAVLKRELRAPEEGGGVAEDVAAPGVPTLRLLADYTACNIIPGVIRLDKPRMILGRGSPKVHVDVKMDSVEVRNNISRRHAQFTLAHGLVCGWMVRAC